MHMHLVIQCDSVATINGCCFIGFRFYVINIEKLGRNYINRAATICTLIVVKIKERPMFLCTTFVYYRVYVFCSWVGFSYLF